MKKFQLDLLVKSNMQVSSEAFMLELTTQDSLPESIPGQFVQLLVNGSSKTMLRRPISIHDIDYDRNILSLLINKVGAGTAALSLLKPGDILNAILPLGNGFDTAIPTSVAPLLIGGGVGIAPLYFLGKELKRAGLQPTFLFGGRKKENLLRMDDFSAIGRVFSTTEDGSFGERGFVTEHSLLKDEKFDIIYTCGPTPMMKAVAAFAKCSGVRCQASLEHKMACGIGACLCCVENTKEGNLCVCKEGPVFDTDNLLWQN